MKTPGLKLKNLKETRIPCPSFRCVYTFFTYSPLSVATPTDTFSLHKNTFNIDGHSSRPAGFAAYELYRSHPKIPSTDRSLIDPDRPQTLYPQHQSTSDHHDSRSERLLRGHTLVAGSGSQFLNSRSRLTSPKPFSRSFTILTSVSPCIHAAFFPSTHSSASLPRFPWVCAKRSSVYQSRLPSRSPSQLPAITNSNQLPIALTSPQAPTTNTPILQKNTLTPNYVYAHNMQISADNFNTKIPLKNLTNSHLPRY